MSIDMNNILSLIGAFADYYFDETNTTIRED
jgi:hypothetical protein